MLRRARAIEFNRAQHSGKTNASRLTCETDDGDVVEVIAKFSKGCDRGETALAMEAFCSALALGLGLPTPQPFFIDWDVRWASAIPNHDRRTQILGSASPAFGSQIAPSGFRWWSSADRVPVSGIDLATRVFAFDGWIWNPDRGPSNPNCLIRGDQLLLIDHELAFTDRLMIPRGPQPWEEGSLSHIDGRDLHIFFNDLRGGAIVTSGVQSSWDTLSLANLQQQAALVVSHWNGASADVNYALSRISQIKGQLPACIAVLTQVLT